MLFLQSVCQKLLLYYHAHDANCFAPEIIAAAMTPPRFYCPGEIAAGQIVELPANAAHHAARVLRLEQGDAVTLFNGEGGEFAAIIAHIDKKKVAIAVEKYLAIKRESPLVITLVQALCANEKMDWVVQKAVELGVSHIQPVVSNRSVVRLSGERAEKRGQHWQQVVIAACEQCGRNQLPQVLPLRSLSDWLSEAACPQTAQPASRTSSKLRLILSPTAEKSLREHAKSLSTAPTSISLLVGPEGGLAPEEEDAAVAAGLIPLRLGSRILRVEGAALAAVAAMQVLWGDY